MFPIRKTSDFYQYFHGSRKYGSLDQLNSMKSQRSKNSSFSKELVLVHRNMVSIYDFLSKVTDSDTESDSSDIQSLLSCNDPSKLVLYSFEPLASSNDEDNDSEGNLQEQSCSSSRIGNTKWCKCNNCRQMEADAERFCCAEADEIHEEMSEGKLTLCLLLITQSTMPHSFKIYIPINSVFI